MDRATRLARLYDLRDKVNQEIAMLERGRAAARRVAADQELSRLAPAPKVREWARANNIPVPSRGRVSLLVRQAYIEAHPEQG